LTLSDLADVGELLGGLAVLVSLIYLVFELRRNTKTARSGAAWDATVGLAELCEEIAGSQELAEICMRALEADADPDEFTPGELARFFFVCRSVLYKYEGQWYLWREGILSNEMWQNRRRWAKAFVSLPVPSRVWELEKRQHQYSAGFIESIETMSVSGNLSIQVSQ
jgi:hypothetical protein